jgi:Beta-eliminating lyase
MLTKIVSSQTRRSLLNSIASRSYGGPVLENTENYIDFRSDTVTRPSLDMLEAMGNAPVGDDVYRDDPTMNKLEREIAKLFGK